MKITPCSPAAFLRSVDRLIESCQEPGGRFSIIVLSTRPGITPPEQGKLLEWGELVLRNNPPRAARVTRDGTNHSCLMLVPTLDGPDAEAVASYFCEQLNKLPVFGVAPGEGWSWDYVTYPYHADGIGELRASLASQAMA
jgi:hypothetical protein